ncbi:MAG: class I SAM-dependent methyltransferase [Thermodesulfobacteriota bacterium]
MPEFYDKNHEAYAKSTFSADPSVFLEPFVSVIPPGACILDAGCGSGRDLLWLKNKGFRMTGFEKSAKLAKLACNNSGCPVIKGDFEEFDFSDYSFDAVIAVGSFVHIPRDRLFPVIRNISRGLADKGFFYISVKQGHGVETDDAGRTFFLWQNREIRALLESLCFHVIHFSKNPSALNSKDTWLGYVLRSA